MAHANIAVFIPHEGCPNRCSFCSQKTISGALRPPSAEEVNAILAAAYENIPENMRENTEIAFFGGSFTSVGRGYMISLLEAAEKFLKRHGNEGLYGIRISARPDGIDREVLGILKEYGVTSIELGAQSMDDNVLTANMRGHTAEDVRRSSEMIRSYGFELGLQMMTGLYKSSPETDIFTAEEIIKCSPDTVRIYPVAVLEGTYLAQLYKNGEYVLYPFEECIRICAEMMRRFTDENIRVIRLGLHAEDGVERNCVAGYYHPALGEIVRSEWVKNIISENIEREGENICEAPKNLMSIISGHKKSNKIFFRDKNVIFRENNSLEKNTFSVNGRTFYIQ